MSRFFDGFNCLSIKSCKLKEPNFVFSNVSHE